MGLDAVVYLRTTRVNTGLVTDNNMESNVEETAAIHKRLGNASMIGCIADIVLPLIGSDSVLFSKVLYSGSHSGDSISPAELNKLESEIKLLRESVSETSLSVENFLNCMSELIHKAREEEMPIVFV